MTTTKRGRGRPPKAASTHHSESVEVRLTPALRASLEADAAKARLTLSDLCRARLSATGEEDGALRAAYLSGYRAAVREAASRIETMGRSDAAGGDVMNYPYDYTRDGADRLLAHVRTMPPEERWRAVRDEATSAMAWCAGEQVSPYALPIPNRVWVAQMMIAELGGTQETQ